MKLLLPLAATLALATTTSAVPNYGHDFVTIGNPGNPHTIPGVDHSGPRPIGAVDYEYRLTRTEVTGAQQNEFIQAYAPYMQESDRQSWGDISYLGGTTWELTPGLENRVGMMSPRLWMRYCNWLHNDKAITPEAFESGAYDTSTFGRDEEGNLTDQMTRSEGARFWIPSLDEWVKGGYWDPNRFGEGEGGYWLYPNSSDEPSLIDLPGVQEGGTNTGTTIQHEVGYFPDVQTPWGLLDYSGGEFEVAERINNSSYLEMGSAWGGGSPTSDDRLGQRFSTGASSPIGLRLASVVPAPGAGVFVVGGIGVISRRRREPSLQR